MAAHDMLLPAIDGGNVRDTKLALDELIEVGMVLKDPHTAFFNLFPHIPGWNTSDVRLKHF
jgi:hypothetical protein